MSREYEVDYELDEAGWWVAKVRKLAGCHTQGRTIEQARERIREALSAFGVRGNPVVIDHIRLPTTLRRKVDAAAQARRKANVEAERAQDACVTAVRTLVEGGLSLRDAGELLGVSRQRAHQLLQTQKRA